MLRKTFQEEMFRDSLHLKLQWSNFIHTIRRIILLILVGIHTEAMLNNQKRNEVLLNSQSILKQFQYRKEAVGMAREEVPEAVAFNKHSGKVAIEQ